MAAIEDRARLLGVAGHQAIDARAELFDDYLRYLIFANALRGDVYPLCVSAERVAQAKRTAQYATSIGAEALAHGSTGAGNDQVRFDVAFEVPAAVALIAAHREMEKLVLSRQQSFWKRTLGEVYGAALHEARFLDPLMRDIEAFLISSQRQVTGWVQVELFAGHATVLGATSPHSLMNRDVTVYGEESLLWNGAEAAAFAKIYGLQDRLRKNDECRMMNDE